MADNSKRIGYVPGICEDCGKVFYHKGFGYFCPECRKERVERGKRKRRASDGSIHTNLEKTR